MFKNLRTLLFLILLGILSQYLEAKIRLFTFHYNRPDFLEIQYKCLKKFLKEKDDFELFVIYESASPEKKQQIEQICKRYGLPSSEFSAKLHDIYWEKNPQRNAWWPACINEGSHCATIIHCNVINYALRNFGYQHNDIIGLMEADVFLTKNFSIREAMHGYGIIGGAKIDYGIVGGGSRNNGAYCHASTPGGIEHLWPGIVFCDIKNLPNKETLNFDYSFVGNNFLDSGGSTYHYLKNNPTVKTKKNLGVFLIKLAEKSEQELINQGFNQHDIQLIKHAAQFDNPGHGPCEFYFNNLFFHLVGSRYINKKDAKWVAFKNYIAAILDETENPDLREL